MNPDTRHLEIRKYPNRRYYDVTRSRHLTLEEIRVLVREGHDIRVTDSRTGADITAKVLAQIILELEEEKIGTFPVALLTRMIRANDQAVKEFVETYFNQAFAAFLQYRKQFDDLMKKAPAWAAFGGPPMPWGRSFLDPFAGTGGSTGASGAGSVAGMGSAAGAGPGGADGDLRARVEALQGELEALRARVASGPARRPAKRKSRARSARAQKTT